MIEVPNVIKTLKTAILILSATKIQLRTLTVKENGYKIMKMIRKKFQIQMLIRIRIYTKNIQLPNPSI